MVKMNMIYSEIAPKFRSRKAFVTAMEKAKSSITNRGDYQSYKDMVDSFINSNSNSDTFGYGMVGFSSPSKKNRYLLIINTIKESKWDLVAYRNVWIRIFVEYQLKFYICLDARSRFHDKQVRSRICVHQSFGDLIAMIAIFGNRALFENATKFVFDVFDCDLVGGDVTSLTQLFMLRLSEKFLGFTPREWLNHQYWGVDPRIEEPLFAELWSHWDDEDTEILTPILIQLLNRHTFQASRNNKDGGRDFEGHSEQYPMEVHFIFRLREWRGLTNPVLTHRLMEPPFDVLPEPMQELVFDEQTIHFVKKVREVFPDFDTIVNNAKIRDWTILL